ncbi:MAG: WGR domain-containing protein [Sphingorhabdus sp.]
MQPATDTTPLTFRLQALDPSRNIARGYRIEASIDLFGHWIVDLHWGRIGTRGQGRTVSFADGGKAEAFIRKVLQRRASAPKRIGINYTPV